MVCADEKFIGPNSIAYFNNFVHSEKEASKSLRMSMDLPRLSILFSQISIDIKQGSGEVFLEEGVEVIEGMVVDGASGGTEEHIEQFSSGDDAHFFASFRSEIPDDFIDGVFSLFIGEDIPIAFDF